MYNGITGSTVLPAVQQVAEAILLLAALFAVYEAYAKGGDARALALAGARYLFMGLLISQYPNVFRNVNNAFANVAQTIAAHGRLDELSGPSAELPFSEHRGWRLVELDRGRRSRDVQPHSSGHRGDRVSHFVRESSFFYSMYGAVLYVCGPLVLGLYPALGVGRTWRERIW